jgi:dihydroorotate dehydrogenase (NAD+) catalytic subunit
MMLAGAGIVGVGTACITDPYAPLGIIEEIEGYLLRNNIDTVRDITGKVILN